MEDARPPSIGPCRARFGEQQLPRERERGFRETRSKSRVTTLQPTLASLEARPSLVSTLLVNCFIPVPPPLRSFSGHYLGVVPYRGEFLRESFVLSGPEYSTRWENLYPGSSRFLILLSKLHFPPRELWERRMYCGPNLDTVFFHVYDIVVRPRNDSAMEQLAAMLRCKPLNGINNK